MGERTNENNKNNRNKIKNQPKEAQKLLKPKN